MSASTSWPTSGARVRRLRRPPHQHLHGAKRAEAHDRRLQRRQFRPQGPRLHPRRADLGRPRGLEGGPIGRDQHEPAARRAALGRGVSRLLREVLHAPRRDGGADREPALCRPDHRSRSERPRRLGPAGAAHDLRLAAAERARAHRVHAEEDGGDRPRHGRGAGLGAPVVRPAPGRASPGRHAHGQRSRRLGGEQIQPELGHPEPVHHGKLDLPDHERLQSDADDPGARLHDRGRHRESLPEEPGSLL